MVSTKLWVSLCVPLATKVPSVEDCETSQGQAKMWALTKNKKNIKKTINRYKYEVHGISFTQPRQQQQQQKQQCSKKQKNERGAGGHPPDDESNDGTIDGFDFLI